MQSESTGPVVICVFDRKQFLASPGKDYDIRTKSEVYEDLKRNDENVVVYVPPEHYVRNQTSILGPGKFTDLKNGMETACFVLCVIAETKKHAAIGFSEDTITKINVFDTL